IKYCAIHYCILLDKRYLGKRKVIENRPLFVVGFYRLYLDYLATAVSVYLTAWASLHASL
ncbi:hypothetical protein, partial [Escherichia coli]